MSASNPSEPQEHVLTARDVRSHLEDVTEAVLLRDSAAAPASIHS